tara:strand:+ start:7220 stop:7855 length:636 start_codon:yes stop_codon:yes gene_type:complete
MTIQQDAVGIGRLVFDAGCVAVRGKADVGVGDMGQRRGKGLFAMPGDVGQRGGRSAQPAQNVDLPVGPLPCDADQRRNINQGRAGADGDGATARRGVGIGRADINLVVRDANGVDRDIGVAGKAGGDARAGGADAGEMMVRLFRAQQRIGRVQQADVIGHAVDARGLRGLLGQNGRQQDRRAAFAYDQIGAGQRGAQTGAPVVSEQGICSL